MKQPTQRAAGTRAVTPDRPRSTPRILDTTHAGPPTRFGAEVQLKSLLVPVLAALLALLHAPSVRAGAWVQEEGSWFLKLGLEQWETEERYDLDAARVDYLAPDAGSATRGDYRNQAFRVYAEYGITSTWTITAATAVERARARGHGQIVQQTGLSDLTLQLKRRLLSAPLVVSVLAEGKVPTGYDLTRSPALGSGRLDGGARLAVGRGFGPLYLSGETGYLARTGRADEFPFALEAGVTIKGSVLLRGQLSGAGTLEVPAGGASFDPARAESRYVTGGVGLVLLGDPLDLVLSAEHALTGRNALAGTRYSFSIWRSD